MEVNSEREKKRFAAPSIDLSSPAFNRDLALVRRRLDAIHGGGGHGLKEALKRFLRSRVPLKNQVLFYTIRSDGQLEGNAAAIFPYVRGEKVIAARKLPHPKDYEKKMLSLMLESRVIVTDDYDRYLRYFPLRQEQKVIQLWHAAGAFKKFGRCGTNLPEDKDLATHVQYSLVCVSGEEVRDIYADAFGISKDKVLALGLPRTDIFFDQEQQEQIREHVYARYPQLRGKRVVLYAPTFRDAEPAGRDAPDKDIPDKNVPGRDASDKDIPDKNVPGRDAPDKDIPDKNVPGRDASGRDFPGNGHAAPVCDRSRFRPPIDFGRLSQHLPEDMVFVIAPHPVMTEKILTEEYYNVLEIRDISTNDLMFVSDRMVTDYSSVIFEYSLLGKPVLFFCYDFDTYDRGFYLRYPEDLPGDMVRTQEEMEKWLEAAPGRAVPGTGAAEDCSDFVRRYMSACDGRSSERIAGIINRYIGRR